ncbi:recombinase family protein [Streptomyces sparsogenes]|uniref:recombinase family protein n=1 Tax=Streptomyces sparsogenes TaxID=67365 RepID=UPI00384BF5FC
MTKSLISAIDVTRRSVRLRAVDYLRVSTEEQVKGYGIAYTGDETAEHIARKGWDHVDTFKDEGESGTLPWQERTNAKRLMELARQVPRPFDLVTVYETRAIGREERVFWRWVWELEDLGIYVAIVDEDIDNTTEDGKARMRDKANEAFKEIVRIRKRTQGGIQKKAKEGGHTGGQARYGYRIENQGKKGKSRLVLDRCDETCGCGNPHEYEVLHLAWAFIVKDEMNARQAAIALNSLGCHTRSGKPWNHSNLLKRLVVAADEDPAVLFRNPGRAKTNADGIPLYGKSITIPLEPIFTPEEVRRLRVALARRRRGSNAGPTGKIYPLSKRIQSLCGAHYTGAQITSASNRIYRCAKRNAETPCSCSRIHADTLENRVWAEVCKLLGDSDRLKAMAEEWGGIARESELNYPQRIADLDRQIASQDDAIAAVMIVAAKQKNPEQAIAKATKALNEEREQLVKMKAEVEAWQAESENASQRARDLQALAEMARTRLHSMQPAQQSEVLGLLDIRVTVTGPVPKARRGDCSVTAWFRDRQRPVPVLTDEGWRRIEPVLKAAHRYRRADRLPEREVVETILNKARTGQPWPMAGHRSRFHRWVKAGVWEEVMDLLVDQETTPVPLPRPLPPLRVEGRLDPRLFIGADTAPSETVPVMVRTFSTGSRNGASV